MIKIINYCFYKNLLYNFLVNWIKYNIVYIKYYNLA